MGLSSLNIKVGLDVEQFSAGLKNAERSLGKFGKKAESIGSSLSTYITAPLLGLGTVAVMAFDESAKAVAQVEAGLKSTGNAAGFTSEQLQGMAADIQKNSLFDDDAILKDVTAQLLTFTNIAGDEFGRAQQSVADFSARTGRDLLGSSIMIGKALNDPVKGLAALGKAGVQFSEEQKTLIKSLIDTGQTAEAQKIILAELEKQYGGSAAAAAEAGAGGVQQLTNSFGDLLEEFGKVIMEGIRPLVTYFQEAVAWFQNLDDATKTTIVQVAGLLAAIGPVIFMVGKLSIAIKALIAIMSASPFGVVITVISAVLIPAIIYLVNKVGGLSNAWELMKAVAVATWKTIVAWVTAFGQSLALIVKRWAQLLLAPWQALALALSGDLSGAKKVITEALSNPLDDLSDIMKKAADNTATYWGEVKKLKDGFIEQAKAADKAAAAQENVNKVQSNGGGAGGGQGQSRQKNQLATVQGVGFEGFTQEIDVLQGQIMEKKPILLRVGVDSKSMVNVTNVMTQFSADLSNLIAGAFADGFATVGEVIGNALTGGTLEDGMVAITGVITNFMTQLGKMLIGVGVSLLALELALQEMNPYVAIGAGIALIAAATMAKNFISKGVGAKADGGIHSGGLTMVGERGPELINAPRGTAVTNATRTRTMLSGGGNGVLTTRISGYDLEIILDRSKNQSNRR